MPGQLSYRPVPHALFQHQRLAYRARGNQDPVPLAVSVLWGWESECGAAYRRDYGLLCYSKWYMSAKDVGNGANQGIRHGYSHAYALEELRAQYHRAQLATAIEGLNLVMHKTWDSRIALVSVPLEGALSTTASQANDAAPGSFLLTGELLDILEAKTGGQWLSTKTLCQAAIAASDGAVREPFTAGALNDINASYYLSDIAFEPEAGLATMYTENRPINLAIGRMLASTGQISQRPGNRRTRVKELCAGTSNAHWSLIAKSAVKGGAEHLDITLSDFFAPVSLLPF
jgi:hypothetical protein